MALLVVLVGFVCWWFCFLKIIVQIMGIYCAKAKAQILRLGDDIQ